MIYLGRTSKKYDIEEEIDEIWYIVRSIGKYEGSIDNKRTKWVYDLSPQNELFYWHLSMKQTGNWSREAFDREFTKRFIGGIITSQAALDSLNKLEELSKSGRKVLLKCFCDNEVLCHRSIIGGMLMGVGCQVESLERNKCDILDYEKYFKKYLEAIE